MEKRFTAEELPKRQWSIWDEWLGELPYASPFSMSWWLETVCDVFGGKPHVFVVTAHDNSIVGGIALREINFLGKSIVSPSTLSLYMPVVLSENLDRHDIVDVLTELARFLMNRFDVIHGVHNTKELSDVRPFQWLGYQVDVRYTAVTELTTYDFNSMGRSQRKQIKKGISRTRGIKEIVRSLELVDTKLLLAGSFENDELEQEIKCMRGWEKVKYYGQVGREKVREILGTARVGLVTLHPTKSYVESMPVKMFEYMSAGIPVVASNFPLWKEIVEGNNCGICVDPLNHKEIANAIEYLLEHSEEAKGMGENGRRAVLGKYNWDLAAQELLKLYSEVLL